MDVPDDELLVDPERPPAWIVATVALTAFVFVVAVVVRAATSHPHASRPGPSGSRAPTSAPAPPLPLTQPTLALDGTGEPVVDATVDAGSLVVLRTDSLLRASFAGRVLVKHRLAGNDAIGAEAPGVRLLIDRAGGVGWAVALLERRARVLTFDPDTLVPRRVWDNDFIVYDAALYGGRVYVATAEGIAWLDRFGRSGHVPNVAGVVSSLAADPARHRLLVVLGRSGSPVLAVTPGGDVSTVAATDASGVALRVVGGRIWAVGTRRGGRAALATLNPDSLRLGETQSPAVLRSGAELVGTGSRTLYAVARDNAPGLWCTDARTRIGRLVANFAPVSVTAAEGETFAVTARAIVRLGAAGAC